MEEKCMEKMQLFHGAKVIAYNSDDDIVSRCVRRSGFKGEKIGWSLENSAAPLYIKKVEHSAEGHSIVDYCYQGQDASYELPFFDEASLQCSYACAAVALYLGLTSDELATRMAQLEPVAMRLEVKEGQHGCVLINDSYNSDINSLDIALDFMARRLLSNRRTLILSDIHQSGMDYDELYRQVNDLCQQRGITKLIGIGTRMASKRAVITVPETYFFATTDEFLRSEVFRSLHDELILIKGARVFGFDQITEQLEQKVHETILEVDLNALVDNLNYFRSFLKPETKLVCMVKADAYGAGAVEVAKTLQDHQVDYLAVAVADEGVTLRRNGITQNIMIMNPEMTAPRSKASQDGPYISSSTQVCIVWVLIQKRISTR